VTGAGLLSEPQYPLDATVELADALLDLATLTGDDEYRAVARDAIASFAGAADRMGVEVAAYASVASRLLEPTSVRVGAPAGSDLHRAALRMADHEKVVLPDADGEPGTAWLETGDGATEAVDSPEELANLVASTQ
jgi:hypothetical protein